MVAPMLAGSGATSDQEDHAGVAAGGTVVCLSLCTLGADLASAGALCARDTGLVGPYCRIGPLEAEEVEGLQRSHKLRNTETGWGPVL